MTYLRLLERTPHSVSMALSFMIVNNRLYLRCLTLILYRLAIAFVTTSKIIFKQRIIALSTRHSFFLVIKGLNSVTKFTCLPQPNAFQGT